LDRQKYDKFVIIGTAFYPKTAEIEAWIRQGKINKIIYINNEYQVTPNSEYARLLKDTNSLTISLCSKDVERFKHSKSFEMVNLNLLIPDFNDRAIHKKYNLIYYGTYRPTRRLYIQRYFNNSPYHLSSSKKNLKRFNQLAGATCIFADKLDWTKQRESLNLFRYTLYIEDETIHDKHLHIANRFYEALMCNCVQFIDINCINSFKRSLYHVPEKYIVSSLPDLKDKVDNYDFMECLKEQRSLWLNIAIEEKRMIEAKLCLLLV